MKQKDFKDSRLIEAFDYIDPKYIAEVADSLKLAPTGGAHVHGGRFNRRTWRHIVALAACLLLLGTVIPVVSNLIRYLSNAGTTSSEITTELTEPETPPEETTTPHPESTEEETTTPPTEITEEETTSEETTAEETTAEETTAEETTAEETTSPPEPEYDGSRGLEYKISDDGTYAILVGIGTCSDKDIVVATTYNGLPVTFIDYSFSKISNVTSITLSDSILTIGGIDNMPDLVSVYFSKNVDGINPESLCSCPNLKVIKVDKDNKKYMSIGNCLIEKATKTLVHGCKGSVIPTDGSVTVIGESAFQGCDWMTELTVPEGIERISSYAFAGCDSLMNVYLPDSLITLGYGVFYHSSALETVRIGKNLETIGSVVFDGCSKLNNLSFPKTLKRMGEMVFMECKSLTSVSFEGTGAEWNAIEKLELWNTGAGFTTVKCSDGVLELYEYDGSRGLQYVQYGAYAQLAGIGTCTDKDIVIASTYNGVPVVIIEPGVFKNNKNIRSVSIPNKVHYIGEDAFAFCTALTDIRFAGTVAQWKSISKQEHWNEGAAFTVIHCTDGDVEVNEYDGSRGLEYRIEGDHAVLVGIGTCTDKDIVTATTYNGVPVTEINAFAFENISSITSVTVSEGVTHIGLDAFDNLTDLRAVYLPSTLESIYGGEGIAFYECHNIEIISVSPNNPKFYSIGNCMIEKDSGTLVFGCKASVIPTDGSIKSIGIFAFSGLQSITSIVIPEGVTVIEGYAFSGCKNLKSVSLPGSLAEIKWSAFSSCEALESIHLGDNVIHIGSGAFGGCTSLREVRLPSKVESFGEEIFAGCAIESVIIPDGVTHLHGGMFINCKDLKIVTLPEGIENIGLYAFTRCTALTDIDVPVSVREIGQYAFSDCTALERITIPRNTEKIDKYVFYGCTSLDKFYFLGTKAEWETVNKGEGWNEGCPFTVIHCSDGDVEA